MSRIACLAAAASVFISFLMPGRLVAVVVPPNNPTLAYNATTETQAAESAAAWNPNVNTTGLTRTWKVAGASQPELVTSGVFSWDQPGIVAAYEWDGTDSSSGTAPPSTDNGFFTEISGDPTNASASFEIWFKPTGLTNGSQSLLESGGSGDGFTLMLEDANLRFQIRDTDTKTSGTERDVIAVVKSALTAADIGKFVQVVGVVDMDNDSSGEKVTLYVNGVQATAVTDSSSGFFRGDGNSFTQDRTGANPLDTYAQTDATLDLRDWDGGDAASLGSNNSTMGGTTGGGGGLDISGAGTLQGQIAIVNFFEDNLSAAQVAANYDAITQVQTDLPQFGQFTTDHTPVTINYPPYGGADGGKAIGFTTAWTYNGAQDGVARNNFVNDGQLEAFFQEGKGGDVSHAVEDFGYLVVAPAAPDGEIRARDFGGLKSFNGTASLTMATGDETDFIEITFPTPFADVPVVLADMLTIGGADPAYVRIWDVTTDGFKMQVDETEYDSGNDWAHALERIGWFAVEQGLFNIGGIRGEAGIAQRLTDDALGIANAGANPFTSVSFLDELGPHFSLVGNLYFGDQATSGMLDDVFATWRMRNVSTTGFDFAAENSEAFDDGLFASSAAPYFAFIAISVPEPSTLAMLLGLGGVGLLGYLRRRRRS